MLYGCSRNRFEESAKGVLRFGQSKVRTRRQYGITVKPKCSVIIKEADKEEGGYGTIFDVVDFGLRCQGEYLFRD